jgi:hypothetical protein
MLDKPSHADKNPNSWHSKTAAARMHLCTSTHATVAADAPTHLCARMVARLLSNVHHARTAMDQLQDIV